MTERKQELGTCRNQGHYAPHKKAPWCTEWQPLTSPEEHGAGQPRNTSGVIAPMLSGVSFGTPSASEGGRYERALTIKKLALEMGNAGYCNYSACHQYLSQAYDAALEEAARVTLTFAEDIHLESASARDVYEAILALKVKR